MGPKGVEDRGDHKIVLRRHFPQLDLHVAAVLLGVDEGPRVLIKDQDAGGHHGAALQRGGIQRDFLGVEKGGRGREGRTARRAGHRAETGSCVAS